MVRLAYALNELIKLNIYFDVGAYYLTPYLQTMEGQFWFF
jgi:hypothetical protein